jgi:hypothetical protein
MGDWVMPMLQGRLAELADQATEYCKTQPRGIAGSLWEKKFAELIVRECALIAKTAEPYRSDDLILRRFGFDDE